jgi:predicted phage baseplate assembly protein
LQIRVNDVLWHEVPTLFGRTSREQIFTTELADDGSLTVRFGDGVRGARLPSGTQNVKARYRRGSGLDGLVGAGQLSTLLSRPPGLKSATNPLAAEGADEPESFAHAQQNAPLTVLTLDRVVSLEDYEDFSRAYSGIAKAKATWTWDGRTRGVFLTVAGPRGAGVSEALGRDLIQAIHGAGDPFVPVRVESYEKTSFRLSGQIIVHPDHESEKVLAATLEALRAAFSFEARSFGQPVMLSEVIALVQSIAGVVAVNIKSLYRTGNTSDVNERLEANLPHGGNPATLSAAQLLTLDPAPLDLGVTA